MTVRIVLPKTSENEVCNELRRLTEAIEKVAPDSLGHAFLGGWYGYGADFENDIFSMKTDGEFDCTCDRDPMDMRAVDHDRTCEFFRPNFIHKASGFRVNWYKYIGRGMEIENEPSTGLHELFEDCHRSLQGTAMTAPPDDR